MPSSATGPGQDLTGALDLGLVPAPLVVAAAWLAGSVPVAQLAARAQGADLRKVGVGTVSGSGLYTVAGFGPLVLAGCAELAKGVVGPLLAGRRRPVLGALAAAAAVVGHDWSPWLAGQGGRGVSLVVGACGVLAPAGAVAVLAGMAGGRAVAETGVGALVGLGLVPVATSRPGGPGWPVGVCLVLPVVAKRLLGNGNRLPRSPAVLVGRLFGDRDDWLAGRRGAVGRAARKGPGGGRRGR